jgi:drug/metabolite transporter superfamily protein YnfA
MTRPWKFFVLALVLAPVLAWAVYRLAKELGFLDPPWNPEHEERRTIIAALYALMLSLCVFLFGYANAWPRVWAAFGVVNALSLLFFTAVGVRAIVRLWRLRHPSTAPLPETPASEEPADAGPR